MNRYQAQQRKNEAVRAERLRKEQARRELVENERHVHRSFSNFGSMDFEDWVATIVGYGMGFGALAFIYYIFF